MGSERGVDGQAVRSNIGSLWSSGSSMKTSVPEEQHLKVSWLPCGPLLPSPMVCIVTVCNGMFLLLLILIRLGDRKMMLGKENPCATWFIYRE